MSDNVNVLDYDLSRCTVQCTVYSITCLIKDEPDNVNVLDSDLSRGTVQGAVSCSIDGVSYRYDYSHPGLTRVRSIRFMLFEIKYV